MATATYTPNRFTSSIASGAAQPYPPAAASLADTLPIIDFNFADLRERMTHFTARFDEFIERGRKRVLAERNGFRMSLADMEDQRRQRQQSIAHLENQSSSHAQVLAREAQETDEMDTAIQTLTQQKNELTAHRDALRTEIASVQASLKQRRDAQAAHHRALDEQALRNAPELKFWEEGLGMRIEGTGEEDRLRFVFGFVEREGEGEGARMWEGAFELNMGGRVYEVVGTKPRLEMEEVDAALEALNETKDLAGFLKTMRSAFRAFLG